MKKNANIEDYIALGADAKLLNAISRKIICNDSLLLEETDKISKHIKAIEDILKKQENQMFTKWPQLTDDYLRVFYGSLKDVRNPIDRQVADLAKQSAEQLFEE